MAISVTDLKPGDRVVLNCPKARGHQTKREAVFEGIFATIEDAMKAFGGIDVMLMGPTTAAFLNGRRWARFLLSVTTGPGQILEYPGGGALDLPPFPGPTALACAFLIEPDGGLREEEGRRVFIERRLVMGQG